MARSEWLRLMTRPQELSVEVLAPQTLKGSLTETTPIPDLRGCQAPTVTSAEESLAQKLAVWNTSEKGCAGCCRG